METSLLVAAVAVTTLLAGCGGDGGSGPDQADPGERVPERAGLVAGPALLPPAASELLVGLPVELVVGPADVEPLPAEVADAGPGQLVLYGDPSAEDPLSSPWVLVVLHQGSENSGLGGAFDPHGTGTSWTDVPVEQLSQESRHAGLLTSGLDGATVAELSKGVEVSGDESGGAGIEIRPSALGGRPETLELITAGSLDVAAIGSAWERGSVAPTVRWDEQHPWPEPSRRLAVTSYAADRALELLLRATNGGPAVGPSVMPVGSEPPDDVVIGVRTIEATTVLVQSTSLGVEGVEQVLDSLEPATDDRFAALRDAFLSEAPTVAAAMMGDPEEMVSGTALGGRWFVAADIERVDSMIGPVDSCMISVGFQFADGSFGGGGARGGYCTELGSVSAELVYGEEAVLVHGDLPTNVARVEIVLDDGSVHEPELVGARRLLFGFVVEGAREEYADPIVAARTYDAAGSPIVDLRDESLGQEAIERFAENWPSEPGG
jgi:hypothetical protein